MLVWRGHLVVLEGDVFLLKASIKEVTQMREVN